MIQLSFDIPPHTNRINEFTKHIIADLGDKRTQRDLAPIATVIGGVCHYNPRTIIRFINRLITDSAIYRQNSGNGGRLPVGVFAVTRSLQHSWRDFYGLLVGDDQSEDREYCTIVANWSSADLASWKKYDEESSSHDSHIRQTLVGLKKAEPQALKQIASLLESDRVLRSLMDGKIGREWLKDDAMREMSVSFLASRSSVDDADMASEKNAVSPGAWASRPEILPDDGMYKDALGVVIEGGKASTSLLQRRMRIGYGRAARMIEQMEQEGVVGLSDGARPREVLVSSVEEALAKAANTLSTSPPAARPDAGSFPDSYFTQLLGQ